MFRNYIKTAIRNFRKQKVFSALNLLGLTVGLATVLLITLYVAGEFGYDRYNVNADRIYRVNPHFRIAGEDLREKIVPADLGPAMRRDYPVVEDFVRLSNIGPSRVRKGDAFVTEPRTCWADSSFFSVFTLPLLAGDPKTVLTQSRAVVISESMAKRQFGALPPSDIVGKTIAIDDTTFWKITGVMRDMPALSHFHFDLIRSLTTQGESREVNWLNNDWETYLLVRPGTPETQLDRDLAATTRKYAEPMVRKALGTSFGEMAKKGDFYRYETISLTRIHLYSDLPKETEPTGNIVYVRMFMVIAIFILMLACVNFMNLSTARSAGRSREVGVRKVLGSRRSQLVTQFLVESVLYSLGAMVLAFLLALLLLPFFSRLSGQQLTTATLPWYWLIPAAGGGALVVGVLAGSYPAIFLSRFQPIQVLKGYATGFKGSRLRNILVVFQFTTAIALVVGSLVIYSQLNFIRNQRLGYDRSQVLLVQHTGDMGEHIAAFKNALAKLPGVRAVTSASSFPTSNLSTADVYFTDAGRTRTFGPEHWYTDAGYIDAMGMTMASGRSFRPEMKSDSQGLVINQTMARLMGTTDPVGKNLYHQEDQGKLVPYHIVGVVKDFHSVTLHEATPPLIMTLSRFGDITTGIRLSTNNIAATVEQVHKLYAQYAGVTPFDYSFMDDDFNKLYAADSRVGQVITAFTGLALLVACLGLFGLVTFAAEQRSKEMSIRKVLGARVRDIIALLARDFVVLILVSLVISFPLAWYSMHRWLQSFAYRTTFGFSTFAIATLVIFAAIVLTISYQAIRAALSAPIQSLKSE